jgi:acetylornithine/N-succinyldiaminopimelate aminotransferase
MASIPAVMQVYRRSDIVMVRGEGCWLFDDAGKRYLDFATGIAVNALGHGHPHVVAALKAQAEVLWLCSNMYRIPQQERLAARLAEATFADSVFFCSSGAEAVEAGIKMLRRYHHAQGAPRPRIITFEGGFHGRTMAGISAGGNDSAREGYGPLLEGFDRVAFNDLAAVEAAIGAQTGGVLIEAVQGEGGVRAAEHGFLQGLRALCDARGLLLMMDEVQCGMGRSGTLLAFEQAGIAPDIATVAKGIGNGFPLGATLAVAKVAAAMTPGSHGSTYGSNPLAMAVGNAVLDVMLAPEFLGEVSRMGALLHAELSSVAAQFPAVIGEVRGAGLLLGLRMEVPNHAFAQRLRANGLLSAPAVGDNTIRILPPLIIEEGHIAQAVDILVQTCKEAS